MKVPETLSQADRVELAITQVMMQLPAHQDWGIAMPPLIERAITDFSDGDTDEIRRLLALRIVPPRPRRNPDT